jgi:hypothetical protein
LRWITAPIGCEPIRKSAPPPALFQRLAYAACEPEWLSSARSSRIAPPLASSRRFIFGHRWGVHEVLRIAESHARLRDRLEHQVGVRERGGQHGFPWLGGLAEGAGERLLHDDVLAGPCRGDRDLVVAVRRRADIHDVHVGRFDERPIVG